MKIYWAGIGSRETPEELKPLIQKITEACNRLGFILRSGAAPGADSFFEEYSLPAQREIYLPWRGFNNSSSSLYSISNDATFLAAEFHPGWSRLSMGAKKLMARNMYQVLGQDLETPTSFIVCWTKDGKASGGTGQALRVAKKHNIPIFNLYNQTAAAELYNHIKNIKNNTHD